MRSLFDIVAVEAHGFYQCLLAVGYDSCFPRVDPNPQTCVCFRFNTVHVRICVI